LNDFISGDMFDLHHIQLHILLFFPPELWTFIWLCIIETQGKYLGTILTTLLLFVRIDCHHTDIWISSFTYGRSVVFWVLMFPLPLYVKVKYCWKSIISNEKKILELCPFFHFM